MSRNERISELPGLQGFEAGDTWAKGLPPESRHEPPTAVSTKAEAGLYSEAIVIEEQAQQAQTLKSGENLLPAASGLPASEKQTKEPKP